MLTRTCSLWTKRHFRPEIHFQKHLLVINTLFVLGYLTHYVSFLGLGIVRILVIPNCNSVFYQLPVLYFHVDSLLTGSQKNRVYIYKHSFVYIYT